MIRLLPSAGTALGLFALLCMGTASHAQNYLTSPTGGLPRDGNGNTYYFGGWPLMRVQHLDGKHMGSAAFTIQEIAFRSDYRSLTSFSGTGRSWTRVTMQVSETPRPDKFSANFTNNHVTTPTQVFQMKWSWPTLSGTPSLNPAPWGGPGGALRFPFTTPFVYSGKGAIVTDYVFEGGKLANNAPWGGALTAYYFMDTEWTLTPFRAGTENLGTVLTGLQYFSPCGNAIGVIAEIDAGLSMKVRASISSGAAGQPYVQAIGTGGFEKGVSIGALCNSLYVDLQKPHALAISKWTGPLTTKQFEFSAPWSPGMAGLSLFVQGAFVQVRTGALALTHGVKLKFPRKFKFMNKAVFQANNQTVVGPQTVGYARPYVRYRIK